MNAKAFEWLTNDQIKIYAVDWTIDQPKGVIALIHGLGEHCRRYDHLAQYFNQKGYAVVGYDRRGHGQSGGKRGHTTSFDAFLDEITQLLEATRERYPNSPLYLYGHSMGGNLTLNYFLRRKPTGIKGVIVTGTWIKLATNPPFFLLLIGKLMRRIYPGFSQKSGLDASLISSVASEVKTYVDDPLVHDHITSATGIDMLYAAEYLENYRGAFSVPLLMMHGEKDQIIAAEGSAAFAKQITGQVEYKEWKDLYHEIHNEANPTMIFDYTYNWMEKIEELA